MNILQTAKLGKWEFTSDEHLAADCANLSIGLILPDIFLTLLRKILYEDE